MSNIDTIISNEHFSIMGQYAGRIYVYSHRSGDFITLKANEIPKGEIRRLAPMGWWASFVPPDQGKSPGVITDVAAELIVRAAEVKGIFDMKKIRGCGAWIDKDIPVFHLGTKMLVNNEYIDIRSFKSDFIYPIKHDLSLKFEDKLPCTEAAKLVKLCNMLSWEDSKSGMLFAGWLFTAPLCGAMYWRSHIYIIGGAGTGKSYITNTIIPRVLGDLPLKVQGSSTEAGIRQALDNDARPIIFDEAEPNDPNARARLQSIISLARQASTPDGAPIVKGTASQSGASMYYIRSAFALSSIEMPLKEEADRQRFTILRLHAFPANQNIERFKALTEYSEFLTPSYSSALLSRGLSMLPIIRQNQRVFMEQGEIIFGKRRVSDQMSMMLAGLYALIHDDPITPQYALEWLQKHDWHEQKDISTSSHSIDLLNHILDHTRDYTLDSGHRISRSVRELVEAATSDLSYMDTSKISSQEASSILSRNGLRVVTTSSIKSENVLAIANKSDFIKGIIKDTHWNYPCYETLSRIQGAVRSGEKTIRFDASSTGGIRCIFIPLSVILPTQEVLDESDWE